MICMHCRGFEFMREIFDRAWLLSAMVKSLYDDGGVAVAEPENETAETIELEGEEILVSRFSDAQKPRVAVVPTLEGDYSEITSNVVPQRGALIINADDWGRNRETTDRTFDCFRHGSVSSVSAMVFTEDSERAADLALENGIDTGLHLNFTLPFSDHKCSEKLQQQQNLISRFLTCHRYAQVLFHPWLRNAFKYVVSFQIDEYRRLYGKEPTRIDGHHHKHLCSNVLMSALMPAGAIVRPNFSFRAGEKSLANRLYRTTVDRVVARRHRCADFFYSLVPLEPRERVKRIVSMARTHVVEIETHPINEQEYEFLTSDAVFACTGDVPVASTFKV